MFLAKSGKTFSLIHLYTEFVRQITLFGPVRRALRDIDNHSWVVDPPPPGVVITWVPSNVKSAFLVFLPFLGPWHIRLF